MKKQSTPSEEYFLDWSYNHDSEQKYRFQRKSDMLLFSNGDTVELTVFGRDETHVGTVVESSEYYFIIHTDEPLDITESYTIRQILK